MTPEERMQEAMRAIWLVVDSQNGAATGHSIREMARVPSERGGFKPMELHEVMYILGTMVSWQRIAVADPNQPWTGQWADVKWRSLPKQVWL